MSVLDKPEPRWKLHHKYAGPLNQAGTFATKEEAEAWYARYGFPTLADCIEAREVTP